MPLSPENKSIAEQLSLNCEHIYHLEERCKSLFGSCKEEDRAEVFLLLVDLLKEKGLMYNNETGEVEPLVTDFKRGEVN